jgi:large subunit ribosomal protein L21
VPCRASRAANLIDGTGRLTESAAALYSARPDGGFSPGFFGFAVSPELAVNMFAVIRTGGKQYKVAQDDLITVEKLAGDPGATIELGEVLMVGEGAEITTGAPLIAGASVSATLVEQRRGPKIIVFKKKRRQNYRRKNGHRQYETVLRITGITAGP